jgi:hypothetical protein
VSKRLNRALPAMLLLGAVGLSAPEPYAAGRWRFPPDDAGRIEASVYSLSSVFFVPAEVVEFLRAVRKMAPERDLLVLADSRMAHEIGRQAAGLKIHLVDAEESGFTPWPRDTFSFLRGADGSVAVLVRPESRLQGARKADNGMGPLLVRNLPRELSRKWGAPVWSQAPVPFHNGQVLLTRRRAWISLHTLEPRILSILGLPRVPVGTFGDPAGIDRYLAAAERAASELGSLYGRPVFFVHPLPSKGSPASRSSLMERIGGGAGFDLDSYLTLLAEPGGKVTALVGDLAAGRELLSRCPAADLDRMRSGYGIGPRGEELHRLLVQYQGSPRASRLGAYLEVVAQNLRADGLEVRRLPLFLVPVSALENPEGGTGEEDFLVTWNNVVVETRGALRRAEGFSGLLPAGDAFASRAFRAAGWRLDLLPPLVRSVVLNGGYRCASNHLRTRESVRVSP